MVSRQLYRIPDAMALLSRRRTVIYEQIRAGRLRLVKQGRARLIPADATTEYVHLQRRRWHREHARTANHTGGSWSVRLPNS